MDIARPEEKRRRRLSALYVAGAGLLVVVVITAALSRLKPRRPPWIAPRFGPTQ